MPKKNFIPNKLKPWLEARKRFRLSHTQIQMARELGLNPNKFDQLANDKQQPWKIPLPAYIEKLYFKRFKKTKPEKVLSIEQSVKETRKKKEEKKNRTGGKQTTAKPG
ncbi:MAG: hypothetical protein KAW12_04715 [Candidatus Aminicenantes bacterium]|nr:hypothetical protein [Candidatus Aminicenantes bacterium]